LGVLLAKFRLKSLPVALFAIGAIALLALEIFRGGAGTDFSEFESGAAYDSNSDITLNADRPASLFLPLDYSSEKAVPLLINLHGYSGESCTT
jgi:poly(3-hydroxybutyrate) depolymerase